MLLPQLIESLLHLVLSIEVVNLVLVLEQIYASLHRILLRQNFGVLISFAVSCKLLNGGVVKVVVIGLLRRLSHLVALQDPKFGIDNLTLGDGDSVLSGGLLLWLILLFLLVIVLVHQGIEIICLISSCSFLCGALLNLNGGNSTEEKSDE